MRAARTVVLVLLIVVSPVLAVAQRSGVPLSVYTHSFSLPAKPDSTRFQFPWLQDPTFATQPLPKLRRFAVPFAGLRRGRPVPAEVEDNVCYTVSSYRHARESRNSDVTVPVGYTTCTPRSKFQVKNAAPMP
jgi:hypothetical protein